MTAVVYNFKRWPWEGGGFQSEGSKIYNFSALLQVFTLTKNCQKKFSRVPISLKDKVRRRIYDLRSRAVKIKSCFSQNSVFVTSTRKKKYEHCNNSALLW